MHKAFPLVNHNGTAAKVKTSRCNENRPVRLGTSGRGCHGQPIIRVRGRAVNGAGALEEERGGCSDRSIFVDEKEGHAQRDMNKKLTIIMEWTGDNFGASAPDIIGCVATGKTPGEVKQAYASALEFHRQGADEGELPEWIMRGEYVLDFELTAGALLKYYGDVVTLSAMSPRHRDQHPTTVALHQWQSYPQGSTTRAHCGRSAHHSQAVGRRTLTRGRR